MRFGVIGLGNHALNRVMPAIVESGNEIAAITTQNQEKGEMISEKFNCKYSKDLHEMLSEDIDAVYIGSPNYMHYDQAMKSLGKDKHVLVEKQMTLRPSEAKELNNLASERRLKVGVGFHLRFHPALNDIKEQFLNENLLEISGKWGHVSSHQVSNPDNKWWTEQEKVGGGSIMGTGVHVIDTVLSLFGKFPRKVTAFRIPDQRIIEDSMIVHMQFEHGFGNALSSREIKPVANDLQILTTDKNILCKNFFSTGAESSLWVNDELVKNYERTNLYEKEVDGFTEYVFGNPTGIAKGEDGYRVVRVVEDAQKFISMVR